MKKKRTKVDHSDAKKIPQSIVQAVFSFFWPLNSWPKKIICVIVIALVAFFTIWHSLPEETKTDIIDYLKGSKKVTTSTIIAPSPAPSVNIQKEIQQNTEGDQSPAVVSGGNARIGIEGKQK